MRALVLELWESSLQKCVIAYNVHEQKRMFGILISLVADVSVFTRSMGARLLRGDDDDSWFRANRRREVDETYDKRVRRTSRCLRTKIDAICPLITASADDTRCWKFRADNCRLGRSFGGIRPNPLTFRNRTCNRTTALKCSRTMALIVRIIRKISSGPTWSRRKYCPDAHSSPSRTNDRNRSSASQIETNLTRNGRFRVTRATVRPGPRTTDVNTVWRLWFR